MLEISIKSKLKKQIFRNVLKNVNMLDVNKAAEFIHPLLKSTYRACLGVIHLCGEERQETGQNRGDRTEERRQDRR